MKKDPTERIFFRFLGINLLENVRSWCRKLYSFAKRLKNTSRTLRLIILLWLSQLVLQIKIKDQIRFITEFYSSSYICFYAKSKEQGRESWRKNRKNSYHIRRIIIKPQTVRIESMCGGMAPTHKWSHRNKRRAKIHAHDYLEIDLW